VIFPRSKSLLQAQPGSNDLDHLSRSFLQPRISIADLSQGTWHMLKLPKLSAPRLLPRGILPLPHSHAGHHYTDAYARRHRLATTTVALPAPSSPPSRLVPHHCHLWRFQLAASLFPPAVPPVVPLFNSKQNLLARTYYSVYIYIYACMYVTCCGAERDWNWGCCALNRPLGHRLLLRRRE